MSVHTAIVETPTPNSRAQDGRMQDGRMQDLIKTVLVIIAVTLAVAATLWLIWTLSTLLIVLILSGFLAYVISPLVDLGCRSFALFGRRRCLSRGWAILLVYALIGAILATAVAIAAPRLAVQFAALTSQLSTQTTSDSVKQALAWFNRLPLDESIRTGLQQVSSRAFETITAAVQAGAVSVLTWMGSLPWLVLIPIFAFFLLKDAEAMRDAFVSLGRGEGRRQRMRDVLGEVNEALAAYIRAQLLACLIVGAINSIGFMVLGVPYALVLGLFSGLMECIPLVGPGIVAVVVVGISGFHGVLLAVLALVFLGVVRILEDYVIYPRLIGRHIDLPPLAVILAVLSGAEIGGVTGVLLAIPVLATAIILVRHLRSASRPQPARPM
jgi:predicted PurR-regulated permease PerM